MLIAHVTDFHVLEANLGSRRSIDRARLRLLSNGRPVDPLDRRRRVEAALEKVRAAQPDHVCITGDLTEDGSDGQFEELASILAGSGLSPARVTLVPGNHDAYTYPDGTRALMGVSFSVAEGERVALLGPNGAGKTTLLLVLIGIVEAQSGEVRVGGVTLEPETYPEVRRRIGVVFQDPDDQLFMPTVWRDVAFGPANLGLPAEEVESRTKEALAAVGMEEQADRAPHHLSGGEARRAAIATMRSAKRSARRAIARASATVMSVSVLMSGSFQRDPNSVQRPATSERGPEVLTG